MAAVAPASYRASPSVLSSAAPSSSATANSATPSKAQENAAAIAAGRRRLDEFQRRKAADKSKKTKAAASPSDLQVRSAADVGKHRVLLSKDESSIPSVDRVDANGQFSKASLTGVSKGVPERAPSPPEVAMVEAAPRDPIRVPALASTAQANSWELVRKDPSLTELSTAEDGRSAAGPYRIDFGKSASDFPGSGLRDARLPASSLEANETNASRSRMAISMVDAAKPPIVSAPPEAAREVLGILNSGLHAAQESQKLAPPKSSGGMGYPPVGKHSLDFGNMSAPSTFEVRGGNLAGIDSSVGPSQDVLKGQSLPSISPPERESTSEKPGVLPHQRPTTDYQTLSDIDAHRENEETNVSNDLFTSALPGPLSIALESRTPVIDVAQTSIKSSKLWPQLSRREDHSLLEQHIEDLTQEKFSLQRALDVSSALADTLAQENSTFTDDYNSQGALVNDLKAEIERLQGELHAQGLVIKKMKADRDKAMQDSSAAVGRSRAFAAEVVALEEKVLQTRAQELKSQRMAETVGGENQSQKRQLLAMDKDRANLKSLIEALEEEKGLLQAQIRKASVVDSRRSSRTAAKIDIGTSTDDLHSGMYGARAEGSTNLPPPASQSTIERSQIMGIPPVEQSNKSNVSIPSLPSMLGPPPGHTFQVSGSLAMPSEGLANPGPLVVPGTPSGLGMNLGLASSVIPIDQVASIGNINSLIKTLGEEREALMRVLRAESLGAAQLRALNADLSRKLEVQTQCLELAVAQKMAHDTNPRAGIDHTVSHMAPEYVDEGDEVVDRMLGWIVHLFPGGSRRKRL